MAAGETRGIVLPRAEKRPNVPTIRKWTAREIRALREAARMSLRDFSARLGISDRMISKWEAGDVKNLRPDSQALLDTFLRDAPEDVHARLAAMLGTAPPNSPNRVLRGIREERGETRAEFAEAMARVARQIGEEVYPDEKYVERLESGVIGWPRPPIRNVLAKLCNRPIGDLGFVAPILSSRDSAVSEDDRSGEGEQARVNLSLRNAILASGMEVAQFAREVGVGPKTVERWITQGRVPYPRHRWQASRILGREESELWPDPAPEREFPEISSVTLVEAFRNDIPRTHHFSFGVIQPDIQPLLDNMSKASAVPVISALREVQRGYVIADRLTGALAVSDAIRTQIPVVEMACEVTRGADRAEALEFACRFMEFCGWIHQDAGDLPAAMFWTDRAFDYAMELCDRRTIAYTLMRKSAIATEAGNPAQGLGIANFALSDPGVLTPRLRAVILRQRAHAHAALHEPTEVARDADNALAEAVAGISQGEEDRAPYCSPTYVAMEAGQSMVIAGQPQNALDVLAKSHSEWSDRAQVRDYALCVSRLATAYAAADEFDQACETAEEAISLAYGIGSRRVIRQLSELFTTLGRWRSDPVITATRGKLSVLIGSFQPE